MWLWQILSIFGDIQFWVGAGLVSLIFLFTTPKNVRKHVTWFTFLVLPAVTLSYALVYGLKMFFGMPRPCLGLSFCPSTYAFPSGHATVVFAVMAALTLNYKDKRLWIFLLIFATLTALSRLMLNVHTPEDVIAGSITGIVIGGLVQKVYKNYQKRIEEVVSGIK